MSATALHQLLERSAIERPHHAAVDEPGAGKISFRELDALSDRVRDRLRVLGVGRGDRVGIYLRKSIDSVAAIFGVLKAGAAYVPVDPGAPARRNAYILNDCSVAAAVVGCAVVRFVWSLLDARCSQWRSRVRHAPGPPALVLLWCRLGLDHILPGLGFVGCDCGSRW